MLALQKMSLAPFHVHVYTYDNMFASQDVFLLIYHVSMIIIIGKLFKHYLYSACVIMILEKRHAPAKTSCFTLLYVKVMHISMHGRAGILANSFFQ